MKKQEGKLKESINKKILKLDYNNGKNVNKGLLLLIENYLIYYIVQPDKPNIFVIKTKF